jgi:hypothetical protein
MVARQVYIVCGESGECDDYQTWSVKAFSGESEAQAYSDTMQAFANRITAAITKIETKGTNWIPRWHRLIDIFERGDPKGSYETGMGYWVETLDLD